MSNEYCTFCGNMMDKKSVWVYAYILKGGKTNPIQACSSCNDVLRQLYNTFFLGRIDFKEGWQKTFDLFLNKPLYLYCILGELQ